MLIKRLRPPPRLYRSVLHIIPDFFVIWFIKIFLKSGRVKESGMLVYQLTPGYKVWKLSRSFTAYLINLSASTVVQSSPQVYPHQVQRSREQSQQDFHFPASAHLPAHPSDQYLDSQTRNPNDHGSGQPTGAVHFSGSYFPSGPHHPTELDAHYWKNMFLELGFGENVDPHTLPTAVPADISAPMPHYMENSHRQQITHQQQQHSHQVLQPQGQLHYHPLHLASYGN
jgi:hypothetical protein